MATPEGTRQITMFVPSDTLEQVDDAAYQMNKRKTDRTKWILRAIEEKLKRDAAIAEGAGDTEDAKRVKEIVTSYEGMDDDGKEWLYAAACAARGYYDFK